MDLRNAQKQYSFNFVFSVLTLKFNQVDDVVLMFVAYL